MVCVIVEDCIEKILNCFCLVLMVVYCVCNIFVGFVLMIDCDNDKNFVVVLCEIVDEMLDMDMLKDSLVIGLQCVLLFEDEEDMFEVLVL